MRLKGFLTWEIAFYFTFTIQLITITFRIFKGFTIQGAAIQLNLSLNVQAFSLLGSCFSLFTVKSPFYCCTLCFLTVKLLNKLLTLKQIQQNIFR